MAQFFFLQLTPPTSVTPAQRAQLLLSNSCPALASVGRVSTELRCTAATTGHFIILYARSICFPAAQTGAEQAAGPNEGKPSRRGGGGAGRRDGGMQPPVLTPVPVASWDLSSRGSAVTAAAAAAPLLSFPLRIFCRLVVILPPLPHPPFFQEAPMLNRRRRVSSACKRRRARDSQTHRVSISR